jgi:Rieske Fe-S protein
VTHIDEDDDGCTVHFENEQPVRADRVVQATHLPVTDPAFLAARAKPMRSYVVAGTAPKVPQGMYLASDAGWSVRPTGGTSPLCIVGGEGHAMADDLASRHRYERLETFARQSLGVTVTHRWSAFDYQPVDGVPFIGRLAPWSQRQYVATGFQKWGMSTSMVAAAILADALEGRANPHAGVFDASRLVSNVGRDLVRHNVQVGKRFVKDRLTATTRRIGLADLEPGDGAVVRLDGTPVALSRDHTGIAHAVRATCTHLGCIVGFNDGDQTWDCPCHGSRFALDGAVLDGPATAPLEPVDVDTAARGSEQADV